jgi:hypothetical protein
LEGTIIGAFRVRSNTQCLPIEENLRNAAAEARMLAA